MYKMSGITTDLLGKQPLQGEYGKFWADPVIATNFLYRPTPRIELVLYGDIGSTLLNNDLIYHVKHPEDVAIFSGTLSGMITRFGFQF